MELNIKKTTSQDLLSCGNGEGLSEKLLLKPKAAKSLQTERVPRSSVLDRLQSFLPQMAESVEEAEKVIEMDVALVELSGSESDSEEYEENSDSEEESESDITEPSIKLPGEKGKKNKANIQVLNLQGE
ncbi:putative protein C12orf45 like [Dissostichus eleginoides]|uniref:Uncharacterized protein n=1 Tax=Dissostichus eleginoides TaxID=100907 RepID=A0AAD9CR97_DISEL|nr:putative protein C12orf45 like [Dissostichus eleginoides]